LIFASRITKNRQRCIFPLLVALTRPSYTVKNIEAIAEGSDMRARLYTLAPGDVIPWHYHAAVTDWYFCLVGILRIETRAPRGDERLAAGAHYQIPPKTAHRISNGGGEDCQFLLLQGVGAYDFNKVQD
jgi:quercetin dioxygenase-like cupin family protein